MSEFSLDDALSGQSSASNVHSGQEGQGQNWNPWGGQNPGQPGFPGQQYPGYPGQAPGQGPGQQYPGYQGPPGQTPGQGQGQQYPGYQGPPGQTPGQGQGQQYPGYQGPPGQGQQYPGFQPGGQQNPGFPPAYPGFPGPGQSYPGAPTPGQGPTDPRQSVPSIPSGPQRVPFSIPLSGGCTPRQCLEVEGIPNGKRFSIDYKIGPDIALHINPRFDESPNVLVRNSFIGGKWGSEERQCSRFPFKQGQPFKLQVIFEPDCYRVSVNNENICQYNHRLKNFSGINMIHIDGALTISGVRMTTL